MRKMSIKIYLSAELKNRILAIANEYELSDSTWARMAVMEHLAKCERELGK